MRESLFERDLRRAVEGYAKTYRIDPSEVDDSLRGFLGAMLLQDAKPALRAAYLAGDLVPEEDP